MFEVSRNDDPNTYAQKRLPDTADDVTIKRFQREARILSALDHPSIVQIVGKRLDAKPYFFVMPRYDRSLEEVLPKMSSDMDCLVQIFGAVLDAMEYAHTQGVLHRDLKPANILIRNESDIAVSDFGLGRDLTSNSIRDTETMHGFGTLAYAPPEQHNGAKYVDERADIFSLGALLYAMLTGEAPTFIDLSRVPPKFGIIIKKCTRPDPDNRYKSLTELKIAWLAVARPRPAESSPDKLRALVAELISNDQYEDARIREILSLLISEQEDTDLVKEVVLELPIEAIDIMLQKDRESTLHLITIFVDVVKDNTWPFDHTDALARCSRDIYNTVDDPETRAKIIRAVLQLGSSHNRWNVLGVFGRLMAVEKVPGEEAHLYSELDDLPKRTLQNGARYLNDTQLEEAILSLFEFENEGEDEDEDDD